MLQQGSRVSPLHDVRSRGRIFHIRKETHDEVQYDLRADLPRCPVARVRWELGEPDLTDIRLDRLVEIEEEGNGSTPNSIQS
ncbi:hypothetical protein LCGC14_2240910 [marine sediment metagenome]|uniref:Uncharacterized protein n=1 Tax=marine sediment metagenome TaxID=412755 RepID=A0A0F9G0I2_9ZZZZ